MTYHHLIEKMIKYQEKIRSNIAKDSDETGIPEGLAEKSMAADEWLQEANMKLGEAEVPVLTPDMDPIMDYANALIFYNEMFDEKVRSEIGEFNELVEQLYTQVMGIPSH